MVDNNNDNEDKLTEEVTVISTEDTKDSSDSKIDKISSKQILKIHNTEDMPKIIPVEKQLPFELNIIGINSHPIFPGMFVPLVLSNSNDIKTVEKAMENDGIVGLGFSVSDFDTPFGSDLYETGTVARIMKKINNADGSISIFISTLKRFRIKKILSDSDPIVAIVEYPEEEETDTLEAKALARIVLIEIKEIADENPLLTEEIRQGMMQLRNPGKIADMAATILKTERSDDQKFLEEMNVRVRLQNVLVLIKKEQVILSVQRKVQFEINEKIEKSQRDYFLREEMKAIQDELDSEVTGELSDYAKFKSKIDSFHFSGEIQATCDSELEKFKLMDPNSSEYFVSRNYLELICSLPWNDEQTDNIDLSKAFKILKRDHYGLDDVKKRIIEYLSVRKMRNDKKGSIIILVGPPGVGKTSVGHSIADAMGKPFYRFSVGGLKDEAEIKGHRRTYIGAMSGKIIQGLKLTKTKSPVFMIDEVDKMGQSHQGDPAAALLEVLDSEQNVTFRDNYLDLPFDLSDVFFILTANTLDTIPEPLLDRAEIIQLSGYIDQEKLEIAKKYLIPKNLKKNGLSKNQVKYTKAALLRIAEEYARESGVRNYEKCLDKIHRKIIAENLTGLPAEIKRISSVPAIDDGNIDELKKNVFVIDDKDLEKYLGKPVFDESEIKKADRPGTCIGLAWTSMGGDTLLIEAIYFPDNKGGLVLTGQMGDVMKESSQIAFNWTKQYVLTNGILTPEWFDKNIVHLHIPEGATPKDGPSAGITMATTFMSLFTGKNVKPAIAMTGELDLTGSVMAIGGLREKTVAAKRNGIKTIFIPKANVRDLEEIPDIVKAGIKFVPVSRAMEVMEQVFEKK